MCEKRKGSISHSTYNNYKGGIEKFEKFIKGREISFEDISVTLLKNFASYCSNTLNNNNTTINYSLNILSIIFRDAQKEDVIPNYLFPFDKIKIKKSTSTKKYLTEEQLKSFIDYKASDTGKAQIIQDMFIFSVYAGGLRFSDVIELQWKHYEEDDNRITKVIRKSKRQHSFKIGVVAADILNKYKKEDSKPNDIIFPFADIDELYFKSTEHRDAIVKRATNLSYCHLPLIGKKINLPFTLSFHVSRHTFATRALNKGMRIEHVSKLMDHTDIGITQVYAKIISSELDNAVDMYIN
jgi:site-specific recombinase XerD